MATQVARQEMGTFGEFAIATAALGGCLGTFTFVVSGFALELIAVSLRNGGIPRDFTVGVLWALIGVFLMTLPAIALSIFPLVIVLAIARWLGILHATFYGVAGFAIGLAFLPLFSKMGVNPLRTWDQLLVEPGLRLSLSGLVAGLVLWKQARERSSDEARTAAIE